MNITASLYEKNNKFHVMISYPDSNNKRVQKSIKTGLSVKGNKRLAMQKMEEIKRNFILSMQSSVNVEIDDDNKNILFTDYMSSWLESMKGKIEENTYDSYKTNVNIISEYFKPLNLKLSDIKPVHIQNFYTNLYEKKLSENTVSHYHANIRKALSTAMKLEIIPSNPADKVEKPKNGKFVGSFYTAEETTKLFEVIKGDKLELAILIALFYGLRRSELVGLKWSAFDFEENTFTIKHKVVQTIVDNKRTVLLKDTVKNHSSFRSLPLVDEIKTLLLEHKRKIEQNKKLCQSGYNKEYLDYVFVNDVGKLILPSYVTKHFSNILKENNLRHIRFHDLRHSCASLLLAKGISMKEIQEWLGHSTYTTTANFYAHLEKDSKKKLANVMSNTLEIDKKENTFDMEPNVL